MSIDLNNEFQERLAEVNAYLDFLSMVEAQVQQGAPRFERAEHPITTQQQRILYSCVYLLLYSLVEATVSRCIEAIEKAIEGARLQPSDLSPGLKREWVRTKARTHDILTPENRLESAVSLFDHLVESLPIHVFTIGKGGGGNWDDCKIEDLSNRLGIPLVVSHSVYTAIKRPFREDKGPLALVKFFRNHLAHGKISFTQCSEGVDIRRLVELKDMTVNYLQEVVNCVMRYVESRAYLHEDRRPA